MARQRVATGEEANHHPDILVHAGNGYRRYHCPVA